MKTAIRYSQDMGTYGDRQCNILLKTDPAVFQAVLTGHKTYEIRKDDRGFAVGDTLVLRETVRDGADIADGAHLVYTGLMAVRTVTHILRGPIYGLQDGWVILSFEYPNADTVKQLTAEMNHWKANHDAQVERSRLLIERPDLPIERVEAYKLVTKLYAENSSLAESLDYANFFSRKVVEARDEVIAVLKQVLKAVLASSKPGDTVSKMNKQLQDIADASTAANAILAKYEEKAPTDNVG